jgi:hypothetical protein
VFSPNKIRDVGKRYVKGGLDPSPAVGSAPSAARGDIPLVSLPGCCSHELGVLSPNPVVIGDGGGTREKNPGRVTPVRPHPSACTVSGVLGCFFSLFSISI